MLHFLTRKQRKEQVASLSLYVDPASSTMTGTNTSTATNKLIDSGADFSTLKPRQLVVNTTDHTASIIDYVESSTTLVLRDDIFQSTSKGYSIDNNEGTESDKFKYPQSAMECIPSTVDFNVNVFLADGTYSEVGNSNVLLSRSTTFMKIMLYINKRVTANGRIVIIGNTTTPANVHFDGTTLSANFGILVQRSKGVTVRGLKVTNCVTGISIEEGATLTFNFIITNDNDYGISLYSGSYGLCWKITSGASGAGNMYYGVYCMDSIFYIADENSGSESSSLRYNGTNNVHSVHSNVKIYGNATLKVNLSNSNYNVNVGGNSYGIIQYCTIDNATVNGIVATNNSYCGIQNSNVSNNSSWGITSAGNSHVYSGTNTGSGNGYGIVATYGSIIQKSGTQPSGTSGNELTGSGGAIYA